ncbi:hypothetical protein J3S85_36550 [Streptomyces lavenduligriseus]|nr:hypothetical protein J3S85_36550 [Streptomyces lavenduligriseus]
MACRHIARARPRASVDVGSSLGRMADPARRPVDRRTVLYLIGRWGNRRLSTSAT